MALRYIDTMGDHYTGPQAPMKWTGVSFQGRGPGLHGFAMKGNFGKGMLFPGNTVIMEMYIQRISIPSSLFDLADSNQAAQISCSFNADGGVEVTPWNGSRLFQSAPDLIRAGIWYHFGWKVFVHPTAGTVEVRLNGATLCNLSGLRTSAWIGAAVEPSPYWSGTVGSFGLGDNANSCWFDDLVVMDTVADGISDPRLPGGGGFTKFIGPVEIKVKRPNAPGLSADWTPSPAPPNWDNVNDVDSDDDTTHNAATAAQVGASDLFQMEDLLPGEDILAVQSLVLARKTEEGVAAAALLVHEAGTTTVGPTVHQPNTYSYMHRIEPTTPSGLLWNKTRWDAIQYGYRRIE